MPFQTLILPPGTETTQLVPIARNGDGWAGLVRVRVTTTGANATLHAWEFINISVDNVKAKYRRVGIKGANNWYNTTLKKDDERSWYAVGMESLVKLVYTSTNPIGFIYETCKQGDIFYPPDVPPTQWNKTADVKPWTTNLAANNPTEIHVPDGTRDAMGVVYWKPR